MIRTLAIAAIAALLAACSADRALVVVPFRAEDRSALVSVESNGLIRLFAVDAALRASSPILEALEDPSGSVRTTALFYADTLATNGLVAGPVALVPEGSGGRFIPKDARIERAELDESEKSTSWVELDEMPSELSTLHIPGSEGCITLTSQELSLQGEPLLFGGAENGNNSAVIVVGDDAGSGPHLYTVDANGTHPLSRNNVPSGFRAIAAAGNSEALYISGTLTGTAGPEPAIIFRNAQDSYGILDRRPEMTRRQLVRTLLTPPRGSEDGALLYTVNERGDVDRYRSEPLAPAHWDDQVLNPEDRSGVEAGAAWKAAGDLYLLAPDGKDILRYAQRQYTREVVEIAIQLASGEDVLRSMISIPDVGMFVGTMKGHILSKNLDGWDRFRIGSATASVLSFAPFRGGFLAGTAKGQLIHYDPRDGFCEDQILYLGANEEVRLIVAFDDLIIVAGVDLLRGAVQVHLVKPL